MCVYLEENEWREGKIRTKNVIVDKEWTAEEVAYLTKSIVKFPPGTTNRWKTIAEDVGMSQKIVIAKAKQIAEKQRLDVEAKRKVEQEKKERQEQYRKEAQDKVRKENLEAKKTKLNGNATAPAAATAPSPADWSSDQQA